MLRNREIKIFCLIVILLVAGGTIACLFLYPDAAWLLLVLSFLIIFCFLLFTFRRYREIRRLSAYLRQIAKGDFQLDVRDNTEGELSILKNEIYKVTVTLYEQAEALKKDKRFLSDVLSDISHQIKTPLTSMTVMADLLMDKSLPLEKRMEFTKNVRQQLDRLQWLVSSLLKLSKMDADAVTFKKEPISVKELVRRSVSHLLILADLKDQKLTITGDENAGFTGDFQWTCEALANIVKNSIEHTPQGGEITIRYEETPLFTSVSVEDNGEGISKEDLPRLFERFFKSSRSTKDSVGIGLAMAKAIVEKQGGTIEVRSEAGKGSCFTLRFYKNII